MQIEGGLIEGVQLAGGVCAYKAIPFAAPPVGNLRWKPPQPMPPWEGIRACLAFGPACPQPDMAKLTFQTYAKTSEDCLYLNVWSPAKGVGDRLPVMVWFHGGAFIVGSASDDLYDGQDLARKGVVVVTANYRLGPFGFLAHPLLSKESPAKVSGNYGTLDQIAVLRWVQKNIAALGGDPDRVTIFGESGGGRSVALLMVSPLAKGLFHRAIMQSSSVYRPIQHLRESWYGRPPMEQVGEEVSRKLGCDRTADPLASLRAKTAKQILEAAGPRLPGMGLSVAAASPEGFPFEPIADGQIVPDDPSDLFDAGREYTIPVIAGSNRDEGTLFLQGAWLITPGRARTIVQAAFPGRAAEVLQQFPFTTATNARDALNHIIGDMNCTYPMRAVLRSVEQVGGKGWQYYFTRVRSDSLARQLGAFHSGEIRFVFNNLEHGRAAVEPIDRRIADVMSGYWVRFAATGDPNGPGLPQWPGYTRAAENYLEIGDTVAAKRGLRSAACDLFEKIEKERRHDRRR